MITQEGLRTLNSVLSALSAIWRMMVAVVHLLHVTIAQ